LTEDSLTRSTSATCLVVSCSSNAFTTKRANRPKQPHVALYEIRPDQNKCLVRKSKFFRFSYKNWRICCSWKESPIYCRYGRFERFDRCGRFEHR
jgi:hypothetical protein